MIGGLVNAIRSLLSANADGKPTVRRSSRWPKVRAAHLAGNPTCAACGTKERLEVHHILPFHLHPERELDPANLLTLCEGDVVNCHLLFGHLRSWKSWNAFVRRDAADWLRRIRERPKGEPS